MNIKANVKWGMAVKIITIISLLLIIVAEYYLIRSFFSSMDWIMLFIAIVIPGVILYFAFETPVFVELTEIHFILHKLKGRVTIHFNQISDIKKYKPDSSEMRFCGSGGIFGFVGKFNNASIGKYQSYVGDYAQAFLIQTKDGKKYVFSCENSDLIITKIKNELMK
jgi:hypothetical protein